MGELCEAIVNQDMRKIQELKASRPNLNELLINHIMNDVKSCPSQLDKAKQPLWSAIAYEDYYLCKYLIRDGADINSFTKYGLRPLNFALSKGHFKIAKLLIRSGANVNLPDSSGIHFPLSDAIHENTPAYIVKEFLSAGFPKNGKINKDQQNTALHKAVGCNNMAIVEFLLNEAVDPNIINKEGFSALHIAIHKNNPRMVQILINRGVNVNISNVNIIYLPIILAIAGGNVEIFKMLVEAGADVNKKYDFGNTTRTPLHFAVSICQLPMTTLLIQYGAAVNETTDPNGDTALHIGGDGILKKDKSQENALEIIITLLTQHGLDVNKRNKLGVTPLQLAVIRGDFSVAIMLVKAGGNVNDRLDLNGKTIFHIVALKGIKELIKIFLDYGADFNVPDEHGTTPYHVATCNQRLSVLQIFWRHGCPYNQPHPTATEFSLFMPHKTGIHIILEHQLFDNIYQNNVDGMLQAMRNGAEPNACCQHMPSPLHYASEKGLKDIVKLLLDKGVSSLRINKHGEMPLNLAARYGHLCTCMPLLQNGACYNYTSTVCPRSPQQLAHDNGHMQLVACFKTIKLTFAAVNNSNKVLQILGDKIADKDFKMVKVLINTVDKTGSTLMASALRKGHRELAKEIMNIRLQIP